jgi:hypothetical protein
MAKPVYPHATLKEVYPYLKKMGVTANDAYPILGWTENRAILLIGEAYINIDIRNLVHVDFKETR